MGKQLNDHISGIAQGNLNMAETLFGFDANALKNATPEAIAALKDLEGDAKFWAKYGRKIQQQVELIAEGTAQKTVTLAMVADAVHKYGKPIVGAKLKAAMSEKKMGNYLVEVKNSASHQLGMENARHATQMRFQSAEQNLQTAIFRANLQQRANQLMLKADVANQQNQAQHLESRRQAAMQLGSRTPFLTPPSHVNRPVVPTNFTVTPQLGAGASVDAATGKGLFGFVGRMFGTVRRMFGV